MNKFLRAPLGLSAILLTVACASTPRESAAQLDADRVLAGRVQTALDSDPVFFFRHVDVDADNGKVLLSGYVWSDDALRRAELITARVPGVTSVSDDMLLEREGKQPTR